jgi:hypothetical protein
MKRCYSCVTVVLIVILVAICEVISLKQAKVSFNGGKHYAIEIIKQNHHYKAPKYLTAVKDPTLHESSNLIAVPTNEKIMNSVSTRSSLVTTKTENVEIKRKKSLKLSVDQKLMRDVTALKTFYDFYGHFRVPYYYMVPTDGDENACVNSRVRRKEGAKTVITSPATSPPTSANINKRVSAQDRGSLNGVERLIIKFPDETHGLRLGRRVAQIRKGEIYTSDEHRECLASIGLIMPNNSDSDIDTGGAENEEVEEECSSEKVPKKSTGEHSSHKEQKQEQIQGLELHKQLSAKEHSSEDSFQKILLALKAHDNLFGDMLVPRYFIVPSEEPWPLCVWGMQLGNRVRNIRAKTAYNKPHYHQILIDLGFCFSMKNERIKFPRILDPFDSL